MNLFDVRRARLQRPGRATRGRLLGARSITSSPWPTPPFCAASRASRSARAVSPATPAAPTRPRPLGTCFCASCAVCQAPPRAPSSSRSFACARRRADLLLALRLDLAALGVHRRVGSSNGIAKLAKLRLRRVRLTSQPLEFRFSSSLSLSLDPRAFASNPVRRVRLGVSGEVPQGLHLRLLQGLFAAPRGFEATPEARREPCFALDGIIAPPAPASTSRARGPR